MTGKHGGEEKLSNVRQCSSERTPVLGIIQRRTTSCPTLPLLFDQAEQEAGVGIAPDGASGLISANTPKILGLPKMIPIGKMPEKNSDSADGAGARKSEEGTAISKNQDVKRKISNALSIGITGAKIASLFFTISSLVYSSSTETEALEVLDEDINDI